jgi:hypothetical protein
MPSTQNRLWGRKWKRVKAYKPVTYFDEFPCIRYPAGDQFVENARDPHFGNFKFWPNDNGIIYVSTMFARKPKPKPVKVYKPRGPRYGLENKGNPSIRGLSFSLAWMEARDSWQHRKVRALRDELDMEYGSDAPC